MKNYVLKSIWSKVVVAAAIFMPLVTVLSCDIGLGEAVDVAAPTLTITYPPSGAVIRDSFVLAGECKDDVMINSVNVRVVNTNTSKEVFNGTAAITGTNWQITLNNKSASAYPATNGWQYADGTYEITAWATDNSGKTSGVSSRSVDVDNTAPVFIIQSPGVTRKNVADGSTPTAYGTVFTVSGTIVDQHDIGKFSMKFFDDTGTEIPGSTFIESTVPTAGGSEVTIATYIDDDTTNQYYKLYQGKADENSVSKKFYCSLALEDESQVYKTPSGTRGADAKVGNGTSSVFLYDDVFTEFLSKKTENALVKGGLSAQNFMSVLNGTYGSPNLSKIKASILNWKKDTETTDNMLAFTLNPNADPKYIVNGFELNTSGDTIGTSTDENSSSKISQAGNNNTLNISLSAGLDGTAIAPWSIHVWMYDFGDNPANFTVTKVQEVINKFRAATKKGHEKKLADGTGGFVTYAGSKWIIQNDGNAATEDDNDRFIAFVKNKIPGIEYVGDNTLSKASSSKQATISTNLPRTVATKHYYVILVSGYDVEVTELAQTERFGFVGMATGERPKIAVASPADLSYAQQSDDIVFKGTATKGDVVVKKVQAKVTVTNEENGEIVANTANNPLTYEWDDADYKDERSWEISLKDMVGYSNAKAALESGKSYLYSAKFIAVDLSDNSADTTRSVHVDAVKPEVEITSITPIVEGAEYDGSSENYVNGNITVKANITETNLNEVVFQVFVDGIENASLKKVYSKEAKNLKYTLAEKVNTKAAGIPDNKDIEIKITARDTVGNETVCSSKGYNSSDASKNLIINQESDKPVVKFMNFSGVNAYATDAQAAAGSYYSTAALSVANGPADFDCPAGQTPQKKSLADSTNGVYEYLIIKENNNLFSSSNKTMLFSITDDDQIDEVTVNCYKAKADGSIDLSKKAKTEYKKTGVGSATYSGSYTVPADDGIYYVIITAKDKEEGKAVSVTKQTDYIKIVVSSNAPEITFQDSGSTYYDLGDTVTVKGNVRSWDGFAKLDKGTYTAAGAKTGAFTHGLTAEAPASGASENEVLYTATNSYGQSATAKYKYNIDVEDPTVGISSITPVVIRKNGDSNQYCVNGIITFTGSANDNSDIDYIEYAVYKGIDDTSTPVAAGKKYKVANNTDRKNSGSFSSTSTVNSWDFTVDTTLVTKDGASLNANKGNIFVKVVAHDVAGNTKTITSSNFLKEQLGGVSDVPYFADQETDYPEVSPSNFVVLENNEKDIKRGAGGNLFNNSDNNTLMLSVSDDDGVKEVEGYYQTATAYNADGSATFSGNWVKFATPLLTNGSSTSVNLSKELPAGEGKYMIKFVVKDTKYASDASTPFNKHETTPYYVGVSEGKPVISLEAPQNNGYTRSYDAVTKTKVAVKGTVSNASGNWTNLLSVERTDGSDYRDTTPVAGAPAADAYSRTGTAFKDVIYPIEGTSGTVKALTYTVKDVFGDTNSASVNYIIDNTAPQFAVAKNGFTSFALKVQAADYDPSNLVWYKVSDISIEGHFYDAHSGISSVSYELTPNGSASPTETGTIVASKESSDALKGYYKFKGTITGIVAGKNNKLVLYATDECGNVSAKEEITIQMDESAPEFKANWVTVDGGATHNEANGSVTINGRQSVVLYGQISDALSGIGKLDSGKAIDFIVNSKKIGTTTYTSYKPAAATPTATLDKWEVASVEQYKDYSQFDDKTAITGWKTTFTADDIKLDGALVVDCIDRAKTKYHNSSVLNFIVDDKAPVVKIRSNSIDVNGTSEIIEGTVTENISLEGMEIYYKTGSTIPESDAKVIYNDPAASPKDYGWTLIENFSDDGNGNPVPTETDVSKIYSWTLENFNFNEKSGASSAADGKGYVWILPSVKDKAGNSSVYIKKDSGKFPWNATRFSVDMNSDRPTVQVSNLNIKDSKYLLQFGTDAQIVGKISDDDAESEKAAKVFVGSEKPIKAISVPAGKSPENGKTYTVTFTDDTTASIKYTLNGTTSKWERTVSVGGVDEMETTTLKGTDWSFTPANKEDGTKTVNFYVVDNKDGVFYTSHTNTLYQPYFQCGSNPIENSAAALSYDSDCKSPIIKSINVVSYSAKTEYADEDAKKAHREAVNTSFFGGGVSKKFIKFELTGYDANKIDGFTLEASGSGNTGVKYYVGKVPSTTGYTQNGTFNDDSETSLWSTDFIDLSTWASGEIAVTVCVYDKSGLPANGNTTFYIDNTPPEITINTQKSKVPQTGDITIAGNATDLVNNRMGSDLSSVRYYVPKTTEKNLTDAQLAALKSDGKTVWQDKSPFYNEWTFNFKGGDGKNDCPKFTTFVDAEYGTEVDGIWTIPVYIMAEDNLGNYKITRHSVWYNPEGDKPNTMITYPSEDQYQNGNNFAVLGGSIRVTGTVEIPVIESGAYSEKVFIQIATADSSNNYDWDAAKAKCMAAINITGGENKGGYGYSKTVGADGAGITAGFSNAANRTKWWGIPVDSSSPSSWVITLNTKSELNPKDGSGKTNNIAIRACSVNNSGKVGPWSVPYYIHIDNQAPSIKAKLRQYADGTAETASALHSATHTVEVDYEPSMYLKGKWYLYLDISDETGIKNAEMVSVGRSATCISNKYTDAANNDAYEMWIPVDGADGVLLSYQINAEDNDGNGNSHRISNTYQFYLDNTAPVMEDLKDSSETSLADGYKLHDSGSMFTLSNSGAEGESGFKRTVFYFIRTTAQAKVSGKQQIFDPCSLDSDNYKTDVGVETKDSIIQVPVKLDSRGQDGSTKYLYGLNVAGTKKAGESERYKFYTNTDLTGNSHIRVGGLIKLDGLLRKIEKITSSYVEFDEPTDGIAGNVNAQFIYAHVVDNRNNEGARVDSASKDGFTFGKKDDGSSKDDGDGLSEKVDASSSTYTWQASVRSTNIPDGPITLVVMTFDNAGNVSYKEIKGVVGNNGPRIAKVFLGTDIDGDKKYQANEFVEYNWSIDSRGDKMTSGYTDAMALKTADYVSGAKSVGNGKSFIVKNGLAVVPEIVGGNFTSVADGPSMVYSAAATGCSGSGESATIAPGVSSKADRSDVYAKTSVAYTLPSNTLTETGNKFYGFTLTKAQVTSAETSDEGTGYKESEKRKMSFTFYDNTEEGTVGVDTQHAVLYVEDFIVDQVDERKPVAKIHPFHWNSKTDNSIQKDVNGNLLGHIELEDDLDIKTVAVNGTVTKTATALKTAYGADPKVSGKIVITGYAYDETRLSRIQITGTANKYLPTNCFVEYKAASEGAPVAWTTAENATQGWKLSVNPDLEKEYRAPDQQGHLVEWKLEVDTEKVTGVACLDLALTVTASDATANASVPGTNQTARNTVYATNTQFNSGKFFSTVAEAVAGKADSGNTVYNDVATYYEKGVADATNTTVYAYHYGTTGKYQMDVVPYVTNIKTSLSDLDDSFPTSHSRSALGKYSVYSTEKVVVEGFNLGNNVAKVTDGVLATPITLANVKVKDDDAANTDNVLSIGALKTGAITLTVNNVKATNNLNNNDAGGFGHAVTAAQGDESIYSTYYYNRQPNGYNNNRLTDDLSIAVWEIDNSAVVPQTGMALQPQMKVNPKTGVVGFAFIDGPLHYAMARGLRNGDTSFTSTSFDRWIKSYDFFTSIGFTYDSEGHSWGTSAGGDINETAADTFHLSSSQWGPSKTDDKDAGHNGENLIHMDQIGVNNSSKKTFVKQRFKSSSIATTVHGKTNGVDNTNIYLAYSDSMTGEIRFKAGTNRVTTSADFATANNTYFKNNSGNGLTGTRTAETQAIAKNGVSERGSGQYVAIAAVPGTTASNDVVVCVWYDSSARKLRYSYNTTPLTVSGRAGTVPTAANPTPAGWSSATTVFSGRMKSAGEYCQIAVDKNKGIHIAAYDPMTLDLVYAYASSYDGTFSTCVVDSCGVVGDKLTLDVAADGNGNIIPYIGYYASSSVRPKYAYKVAASENAPDGAVSDKVTGKWESIVVPTTSTINHEANGQYNKINVSVWTSGGTISNSTTQPSTATTIYNGQAGSHGNWGFKWGNGSKNAILGYAIDIDGINGNIETAQLRADSTGN